MRFLSRIAFTVLSLLVVPVYAQNARSFVATYGNDANDCTVGHECRTFARAMAVTNGGGEILALSSGGYGPFSIGQSITIIATTGAASITTSGAPGIQILAGSSDRIVLKGLSITVNDTFSAGINAQGFGELSIDHCSVVGGGSGYLIQGGTTASIADSVALATSGDGFDIASPVAITRCRAERNASAGINVLSGTSDGHVYVSDFVGIGNSQGVNLLVSTTGHNVSASLDRVTLAKNTNYGVFTNCPAGSVSKVVIANSTVVENGQYGLAALGVATIGSIGNNTVANNGVGDTNGNVGSITAH